MDMWYILVVRQRSPRNVVAGEATNCNANICPSCNSSLSAVVVHMIQGSVNRDILRNMFQLNPNSYHIRIRMSHNEVALPLLPGLIKLRSLNTSCNGNSKCLRNSSKYALDHIHRYNTSYCTQNT